MFGAKPVGAGGLPMCTPQHEPYEVPKGKRAWHVNSSGLDLSIPPGKQYTLVNAGKEDCQKVTDLYLKNPVNGYDIKSVVVIHNPALMANFQSRVDILNLRKGNPAFAPKWTTENKPQWRAAIYERFKKMAESYSDSSYPAVKLVPMWHGTKNAVVQSICETGFANLALTDVGFFGKGVYSTAEANYAFKVYGQQGTLIVNWVACFSAYPVIDGDMPKLQGKGNYANYDAHFIPVVPKNPNDPNEVNFIPCKEGGAYQCTEMVVFEQAQCFPRYVVTLQPRLPQAVFAAPAANALPPPAPATNNTAQAQYEQGKSYFNAKDYPKALGHFLSAARVGHDKAEYNAGYCYYFGHGTPVNYYEAFKYLKASTKHADQKASHLPNAYYLVGMCYYNGTGCINDLAKAKGYLIRAVELGSKAAITMNAALFKPQLQVGQQPNGAFKVVLK